MGRRQYFLSALELLKLIDNTLEEENRDNGRGDEGAL